MTVVAKFGNSLKFEPRGSGAKIQFGPVYGPAGFLALRQLGDLKLSTDGITWADHTWDYGPVLDITALKVVNNQYIIISTYFYSGNLTSFRISKSSDGLTWTHHTSTITIPAFTDIAYANGYYMAVNGTNTIYKSTDLITWTEANPTNSPTGREYNAITVKSSASTQFIVAGNTSNNDPAIATGNSTGTTWTYQILTAGTGVLNAGALQSIGYDGTYVVAAGKNGSIWYLSGTTWTRRVFGTNDFISIKNVGTQWVILSLTSIVKGTPTNGFTNVTQVTPDITAGTGYEIYRNPDNTQLAYGAGVFIFRSQKSTDGVNWTPFDYQLPNQQPYLDYYDTRNWNDWKTIDFWTYLEHTGTDEYRLQPIASQVDGPDGPVASDYWAIYFESQNGYTTLFIQSGNNTSFYSAQLTTIPVNSWFHTRIVISDTTGAVYINGQRQKSNNYSFVNNVETSFALNADTFVVRDITLASGSLNIGRIRNGRENDYPRTTSYWIDEFMVNSELLNSPAATSIPVPVAPWNNTENTMLLLHFDDNYLDDNRAPFTLSSDLVSASSITINANSYRLHDVSPVMSSSSNMTVSAGKLQSVQAQFVTTTAELITATRGIFELANFDINSTVDIVINRSRQFQIDVAATSNLITVGNANRSAEADMAISSTLTAQASDTLDGISLETTTSSMTIIIDRVKFADAQLVSTTELLAQVVEIDNGLISSTTTSSMTCEANVAYSAAADLQVTADMAIITNGVLAHVELVSETSLRATCKVTLLDLGINYMIPADNRSYTISAETRTGMIEYEDRTDLIGRL